MVDSNPGASPSPRNPARPGGPHASEQSLPEILPVSAQLDSSLTPLQPASGPDRQEQPSQPLNSRYERPYSGPSYAEGHKPGNQQDQSRLASIESESAPGNNLTLPPRVRLHSDQIPEENSPNASSASRNRFSANAAEGSAGEAPQ